MNENKKSALEYVEIILGTIVAIALVITLSIGICAFFWWLICFGFDIDFQMKNVIGIWAGLMILGGVIGGVSKK